jgi:hypothetical protein
VTERSLQTLERRASREKYLLRVPGVEGAVQDMRLSDGFKGQSAWWLRTLTQRHIVKARSVCEGILMQLLQL